MKQISELFFHIKFSSFMTNFFLYMIKQISIFPQKQSSVNFYNLTFFMHLIVGILLYIQFTIIFHNKTTFIGQ